MSQSSLGWWGQSHLRKRKAQSCSGCIFTQVFTIHDVKYNKVLPTFYALLPEKSQQTYSRVIKQIQILKFRLSPVSVLTDFENFQIDVFNDSFPEIRNRMCSFHFSIFSSFHIWRKIQSIADIKSKYEDHNDPAFVLHLRKLAALVFVPEPDVMECF